jgi:hypothetical protein
MKIEFLKEVQPSGDVYYYTNVDNSYSSGSAYQNYEKAKECFDKILANPFNTTEILESHVI